MMEALSGGACPCLLRLNLAANGVEFTETDADGHRRRLWARAFLSMPYLMDLVRSAWVGACVRACVCECLSVGLSVCLSIACLCSRSCNHSGERPPRASPP
jgi:hypothetical protein